MIWVEKHSGIQVSNRYGRPIMFRNLAALLIFFFGGVAALSWQVLWQLDLALALGVSAKGTALTVAVVMSGMTLGALWMGNRLELKPPGKLWQQYGILEFCVGLFGWSPALLLPLVESTDAAVYQSVPLLANPLYTFVVALTLGPSSFAMGATLPVTGLIAGRIHRPLSRLYAANTAGAASGALLTAFFFIPQFGKTLAGLILFGSQIAILVASMIFSKKESCGTESPEKQLHPEEPEPQSTGTGWALIFASATGFAVFSLEVSWFRLLRAAWLSTSDSFAIMLFVFLTALAIGAWISKAVRNLGIDLGVVIAFAGMTILLATPLVERFDQWGDMGGGYLGRSLTRVLVSFLVMGLPVTLMGISLPWLLDEIRNPRNWARIYCINTIAAVAGSLTTAWCFMALLGPVRSSWLAGCILVVISIFSIRTWRGRLEVVLPSSLFFAAAWWGSSGVGEKRIQGPDPMLRRRHQILANVDGPDVTTSVVKLPSGATALFIDGYAASGEFGANSHYTDAMGRLPMLLHPDPKDALVICFGTGQTARAVLDENPEHLTVVDINPAVFQVAGFFQSNRKVLDDPRVRIRVMDGRAWLRRSGSDYDVITLEPMPPFFAGVNSLYSVEFYKLIHQRLRKDGFVAQWFPMHLMSPDHARSVASAFTKVFPAAVLWIDPNNRDAQRTPQQGILIGRKGNKEWDRWPGFNRPARGKRPLNFETVDQSLFLDARQLADYTANVTPVTDDNQILSYGKEGLQRYNLATRRFSRENMIELQKSKQKEQQ